MKLYSLPALDILNFQQILLRVRLIENNRKSVLNNKCKAIGLYYNGQKSQLALCVECTPVLDLINVHFTVTAFVSEVGGG